MENEKNITEEHDNEIAISAIIGTITIQVGVYAAYKLIRFAIKKL